MNNNKSGQNKEKPRWWISQCAPSLLKSERFNQIRQKTNLRGNMIKIDYIADLIGSTHELDSCFSENPSLSSAQLFEKILYQTGSDFAAALGKSDPQAYVSIPLFPCLFNDQKSMLASLESFRNQITAPNAVIQLSAIPENIEQAAEIFSMGHSLYFTCIMADEQMQLIVEQYCQALHARKDAGQEIESIRLFVSMPIGGDDVGPYARGDYAKTQNGELERVLRLHQKIRVVLVGDDLQGLIASGANAPELIWSDILPGNGSLPESYYVAALQETGDFEANLFKIARILQLLPASEQSPFPDLEEEIPQADLGERLDSFYDRLRQQISSDMAGIHRLMREKDNILQSGKKVFCLHNANKFDISKTVEKICREDWIARIWLHDHTVWASEPKEITNRLGWLHCPERMIQHTKYLESFVAEIILENRFTNVILCGMGGSSLAPEVFQKTFGTKPGYLELSVLDSTDPWAMNHVDDTVDLNHALFIISTKSGSTIETVSMMKYYYHKLVSICGPEKAGEHFIAITDPGSSLIKIAEEHHFRKIFLNDPNIGGRYSALSYFGLLPAALIGIDVRQLLQNTSEMQSHLMQFPGDEQHMGLQLGAILGQAALAGRDKLTFILSPAIESFGDWVEQLVAESTGKNGKGILPVVGEKVLSPRFYQDDRLFVYMHLEGDNTHEENVQALLKAGFPMIEIECESILELGSQFLLWEFATALAGAVMGIQPFDQPDVENAKIFARKMIAEYKQTGSLTTRQPIFQQQEISVFGECGGNTLTEILAEFLNHIEGPKYCAVQAYLPPSEDVHIALADIQTRIHANKHCAATVGLGPRYLHSTGQLHKGDCGNGVFLQVTSDPVIDLMIPDEMDTPGASVSFGILKLAAALGDQEVLRAAGRPVLHIHLGKDVYSGLKQLALSLAKNG
jgi:glucose-6-phosphate isomerase